MTICVYCAGYYSYNTKPSCEYIRIKVLISNLWRSLISSAMLLSSGLISTLSHSGRCLQDGICHFPRLSSFASILGGRVRSGKKAPHAILHTRPASFTRPGRFFDINFKNSAFFCFPEIAPQSSPLSTAVYIAGG